ncbi:MAG TPA: ABC transporter substrate-binding protein [Stellaceae bacterium]|nr:ABC transporter substrate-binding protein [Stellaceae bacterium]
MPTASFMKPVSLCVAALLAGVLCGTAPAAADEKVIIGWSSADASFGPLFYAQDKGYFKKHELDTTFVFLDSGAKGVQGLVGGGVDMLGADGFSVVNAGLSGVDVRVVGSLVGVLAGRVVAAKDIQTPQDLKGKKWGISSFGSEAQMAEKLFLKTNGLPDSSVTEVQLGNQGNRFAALDAGQIAASTFLPPIVAKVEAAGYHVLAQLPELAPEYMSAVHATLASTIAKRRAMVKAYLEAIAEATAAFKKDRAGGIEVFEKYLKANEGDAGLAWDYYAPIYPAALRPTPKSVQFLLDQSTDPKAKTMTPANFLDLSLLDELETAGFFKTLN